MGFQGRVWGADPKNPQGSHLFVLLPCECCHRWTRPSRSPSGLPPCVRARDRSSHRTARPWKQYTSCSVNVKRRFLYYTAGEQGGPATHPDETRTNAFLNCTPRLLKMKGPRGTQANRHKQPGEDPMLFSVSLMFLFPSISPHLPSISSYFPIFVRFFESIIVFVSIQPS